MIRSNLILLSCLVVFNVALTTEVFANDDDHTSTTVNFPASVGVSSSPALNLGASLTFSKKDRQLDFGVAAGKGVDGPTLSANLHGGINRSDSRWYYLAGYRFTRYADTSESFEPVFIDHLLTGRVGVFLPKKGQFRVRLEGELGVPMVSIFQESGVEDRVRYFNFETFYVGVSLALSYSFR